MNSAEFEKIVGVHQACTSYWHDDDKFVELANIDSESVSFDLTKTTPFQVRCGCFAIGVPCDWDQPVSFERLMELDGAVGHNGGIYFKDTNNDWSFEKNEMYGRDVGFWAYHSGQYLFPITTMRQVHLLLEAAGVGT